MKLQDIVSLHFRISTNDIESVCSLFEKQELQKGEFFLKKGQYCNRLSFIINGYVRIFAQTEKEEVTQWISSQGYFLTELNSFIFKAPSRLDMQALTNCTLFTINEKNYQKLNEIVSNWHELEKQFIARCFITLEDRIFKQISLSSEERYQWFFENNKELFNHIPLKYIASMLGMSPETLSRIRTKFIS